jgi:glycosyltransferase involved in cell wall biosynthesis
MSFLDRVSVLILTYNEAPNIARTLDALAWAKNIVVIDSLSTDETLRILAGYPRVKVLTRPFDDFAGQCNFGLTQIDTDWVLSLDADYVLSCELNAELARLTPPPGIAGYRTHFVYSVYGHPLRGTLYPPRTVLYQRRLARYHNEGHGHRVTVDGEVRSLNAPIYHDDRKPFSRWFASQQRYAELEARYLIEQPSSGLRYTDRIRRMAWPAPFLVFFYTLLAKRCILDGWPGWLYVLQRTLAEMMIAIAVIDQRLRTPTKPGRI